MKKHLFLSYRSLEREFTKKLAKNLHDAGFSIWMDALKGIQIGDDWVQTLQNALNDSIGLIAVLTPEYVKSSYCLAELHRVHSLGKPIFPVLLRDFPDTDKPLEIERSQYVDFRQSTDEVTFQAKLQELIDGLKAKHITESSNLPQLIEGEELAGRKFESEVIDFRARAAEIARQPGLKGIEAQDLLARAKLVEEQLVALMQQLRLELDSDTVIILKQKVSTYRGTLAQLEQQLASL